MSSCAEIGNRIKELRQREGLTQEALSQKLCISRETVNQWERGSRDIKTHYTVELAKVLHTTCDYLLTGIETKNVDFCEKTGISNEAYNNLLRVCSHDGIYGEIASFFFNDLVGSRYIEDIFQRYFWCCISREQQRKIMSEGLTDALRRTWLETYQPLCDAFYKSDILEEKKGDELITEDYEYMFLHDYDFQVFRLMETIKEAIKEG